ncbi:Protein kinase domain [Sesbania bispinosa]|nr:Protein kinase domain [Sesbania bispinosa]
MWGFIWILCFLKDLAKIDQAWIVIPSSGRTFLETFEVVENAARSQKKGAPYMVDSPKSFCTLVNWGREKNSAEMDFFSEYGDASRYKIQEVIGKGSYGVVCSAIDTHTGEKVAIKKIHNIFEHISDTARILREIKLLRLLRHPDIVEIKHVMLPPSRRDFKDIFVVFELMESDLHQVIKANDDLTKEHYQFFLYQLLRALKYIHTATRWYRAPELCGSFYSKYTPAIDMWSIGCIFAEVLIGKPLFPGKNVVHQLDLITDLLGTPPLDTISQVRNDKARRYLTNMRKKQPVPFAQRFPKADPLSLRLLERLLAFDPKDRPTAEEALADPYFKGLAKIEREPSCQPITKLEFEFERRRVTKEEIRELIFREILEYHPQLLKDCTNGTETTNFLYPSAVDQLKNQFAHLEETGGKSDPVMPLERKHASLPRSTIVHSNMVSPKEQSNIASCKNRQTAEELINTLALFFSEKPGKVVGPIVQYEYGSVVKGSYDPRTFIRGYVLPSQSIPNCILSSNMKSRKPLTQTCCSQKAQNGGISAAAGATQLIIEKLDLFSMV